MNGLRTNINPRVLILTENPIYSQQLRGDRLYRYQIQQCSSTIEALEICQPEQIQCLILDWESTEINQDFLQHLRQVCIPVVLLVEEKNEYIVTPLTLNYLAQDYLIKETLTTELLCFAVGQAITQAELKRKLALAEKELHDYKQSELNFQAFLNNAPAIIYTKDLDGRYLSINKEFEEVLQFTPEQVCGKTDLDFLPLEIATALRTNDQKAILNRTAIHLEETVELEDGLHTFIATKFPLVNDHNEPYALAGISFDISDRKAAENSLKELNQELEERVEQRTIALKTSENRYHALMDGASDGILQADMHGNLVNCNRQAERLIGYSRQQLLQLHMSQIHPTEVLAGAIAHFTAVKAGLDTSVLDSLVLKKDGSQIPVEITASLIEINGELIVQGIFRDISDRKLAEESIKKSELKLRKLTENIPVALYQFLLKTDGSISFPFMSHGSQSLFGLAPELMEADGNAVFDLVYPADLPILNQSIQLSAKTLEPWLWEGRVYASSGELKWISGISQPELLANGDVLWHGMLRDISEQQAALRERQKVEIALQVSEANNRAILETIPDLLLRLGRDGTCLAYIKPAIGAERFLPIENHISEVLPVELLQKQLQAIEQAIATGNLQIYEHQFLKYDRMIYEEVRILAINDHEVLAILRDISEQKLAESKLASSQAELNYHIDNSPLATIRWNQEFQVEYWSTQSEKIFGWRAEEVIGKYIYDCNLIFEDDLEHVQRVAESLMKGIHQTCQNRNYRKDGSIIHCEWYNSVLMDESGNLVSMLSLVQDVSDRKKLEQEQTRLIAILEATPDYIGMVNAQGEILWHNKQLRTLRPKLGSHDLHRTISDCHPDWANKIIVEQALPTAIQDGSWSGELALLDGIGGEIPVSQVIIVHKSADGTVENFSTIMRNISDRKKAEVELQLSQENLRQSKELLQLTFENTPIGICIFNLETQFLSVNKDICSMFGYSPEEMLQMTMLQLIHPDFREITTLCLDQLLAGEKQNIYLGNQYKYRNGKAIDAISRVSLIKDLNGIPIHFVASVEDITEQKLLTIALNQRLERQYFLKTITQQIRQSLDLEEVLTTTVNEVRRLLGCDRIIIVQLADGIFKVAKENVAPNYPSTVDRNWLDQGLSDQQYLDFYINSNILIINDVSQANGAFTNGSNYFMQSAEVKSMIVAPIVQYVKTENQDQALRGKQGEPQLWGLIIAHSCGELYEWKPEEADLMKQIANQLAIAIQQANLYQKLSSELNQKKVLLKEIHHRVKNNLQVMSSILHLQFRNTPPEIKLLTEEYQNRILAMSLIHDQLYRSEDLGNIGFYNYIDNLTTNLFQCYGTNQDLIQLQIEVNNIFLPLDQSIPLGLIINELVSNALKYAFPKMHGNIKIKLVQTNANLILTVSDNGVGIPADLDLANADGLGMQLIQSLTEQLDGEFSFDGKNGLTVQITFPNF